MMKLQKVRTNYHTHTTYCDGANTPREMVEAALARGFYALGFSGHAHEPIETYAMTPEAMARYCKEIRALQAEYAGQIALYLGYEIDSFGPVSREGLDYCIGSVHYVLAEDGRHYCVDNTPEMLQAAVADGFSGDSGAFVQAYYREVMRNVSGQRPDIVGHFDLPTKLNAGGRFFDEGSKAYKEAAFEALEEIVRQGCIVEVNTGGMAKGYTRVPYPALFLLERLYALGGRVMINADAHSAEHIDHAFDSAAQLLYAAGFRERVELGPGGFHTVPL